MPPSGRGATHEPQGWFPQRYSSNRLAGKRDGRTGVDRLSGKDSRSTGETIGIIAVCGTLRGHGSRAARLDRTRTMQGGLLTRLLGEGAQRYGWIDCSPTSSRRSPTAPRGGRTPFVQPNVFAIVLRRPVR